MANLKGYLYSNKHIKTEKHLRQLLRKNRYACRPHGIQSEAGQKEEEDFKTPEDALPLRACYS